ncbi:nuclear transport factor 2 family protein [Sphingobium sp. WCS2017Hpa-17]|uniref:nuclear transport factor 2 family protein n=1 Tax=Sphingobium sp. WCS2017Hpa-17 TaxID=3073638 RepID=UPI00288AB153|nr:nuclear transport factor 2 family protein [Sphingobium sp. WCS2017Hpa-17]
MDVETISNRLERLEAIEAIRALKARYLNACDRQDPAAVRACFKDGTCPIDTGYRGIFSNADDFVAMYAAAACHDHVFDKHQGSNAEIGLIDSDHASGFWCLDYRNINGRDQTLTLMSTFYRDSYVRAGGRWLIASSSCEFRTVFHGQFGDGSLEALLVGRSLANPAFQEKRAF